VRLALWTPRPEAAWVTALVPLLEREAPVEVVAADDAPERGLDLYHVADDPAHAFVHRALRRRPGVVLLADWTLHALARADAERGGAGAYASEARRAHGSTGAFIARQVERGTGGELPSLLAMNDRVLDASLGLVAFTELVRARAAKRLPGRPVVHLPLDFVGWPVGTLPAREAAREALGVPAGVVLVALLSAPGDRAAAALRAVRAAEPALRLHPWPEAADEGTWLLAAADVAVALEHAPCGGLPSPLVRAIAAGLPTLVSAGTGAASDLPEGVAVRVSPGPTEAAELGALLLLLARDERLRERVSAQARAHAEARRDPEPAARTLLSLAAHLERTSGGARRNFLARQAREGTLLGSAIEEVLTAAHSLGLADLPPGIEPLVGPLLPEGR
jgi:hypothetical protein